MHDREAAQRIGRGLSAFVHALMGAAITVVVLAIFAGVSLWWLAPVAVLFVATMCSTGLIAARLIDAGKR
jgi:hypothetical protein